MIRQLDFEEKLNDISEKHLKNAGIYERTGNLASALSTLLKAKKFFGNNKFLVEMCEMNIKRIIHKAQQKAISFFSTTEPVPLFEFNNNPRCYGIQNPYTGKQLPPIISFTSISIRIDRVVKTVESITNQTIAPHSINLYISQDPYLIDEGIQKNDTALKKISELGVNIYQVPNIGSYRKLIPLIVQLKYSSASINTPIITIDDDVIYPPNIVERLTSELENECAIISHRGRKISLDNGELSSYDSFPPPTARSSVLNIGTGKNGIAYRLGYFPSNIKDFVGHILAPTADDIWCKWATSSYCIPTIILEPTAAYDHSLDFPESDPSDKNGLFHKYNAKGTNDEAMANLEAYFRSQGTGITALFGDIRHG